MINTSLKMGNYGLISTTRNQNGGVIVVKTDPEDLAITLNMEEDHTRKKIFWHLLPKIYLVTYISENFQEIRIEFIDENTKDDIVGEDKPFEFRVYPLMGVSG